MARFGDIVANVKHVSAQPTDGFDLLLALAERYAVEPAELLDQLSGPDVLARICRDVLGLPGSTRRRGRTRDDQTSWRLFRFVVEHRLLHKASLNDAIRAWVAANGGDNENGSAEGTWLKRYKRQAKRWGDISSLQMLYMAVPPEGT
ncbi:hypothetical protein NLY43_18920 [Mesorhizobium sp. C416B]|uniref:hypothetical protein n=1 Tax=unclassified Mesorhizobium TaxID=325217 RepID=UPI0003CE45E9|nr:MULTISPECIES: hypothetical protein [unclassified Mesorhizobium]ESX51359.1 hypothetical protein X762_04920 [Mesorhizobium sp. LSHC426A00]ESX52731.1 hypothetical protein X761_22840 [Mesorhizobium sp. LSHC424B00]ESX66839.1 hypothetical protein X758_25270 [Mesorhizobium sp. LSHC416B00]WJI60695.1 hypothetical protein NLY43_18920 [Mesorhizobium sp. C416B]